MDIPTNEAGMFEAVTEGGTVVGVGRVDAGQVQFDYGAPDNGGYQDTTVMSVADFGARWEAMAVTAALSLRAAA